MAWCIVLMLLLLTHQGVEHAGAEDSSPSLERTEAPQPATYAAGSRPPWLPQVGAKCTMQPCACERSGMCSFGHVKQWIGPIKTLGDWTAAVEARSFKNEVSRTKVQTGYSNPTPRRSQARMAQ